MPVNIGSKQQAGFDDPLGLLKDCHRRIEYFLGLLMAAASRDKGGAPDAEQSEALNAALHYFRHAAPKHTLDEEESLFPRLRLSPDPLVRTALRLIQDLSAGHDIADDMHGKVDVIIDRWLLEGALSDGDRNRLSELLADLKAFYEGHIAAEEGELFPLAAAVLADSELQAIGREMADRRGVQIRSDARALSS